MKTIALQTSYHLASDRSDLMVQTCLLKFSTWTATYQLEVDHVTSAGHLYSFLRSQKTLCRFDFKLALAPYGIVNEYTKIQSRLFSEEHPWARHTTKSGTPIAVVPVKVNMLDVKR